MKDKILKEKNLKILFGIILGLLLFLIVFKLITKNNIKVKLNTNDVDLSVGDTYKLKTSSKGKLTFECEDKDIAVIDSNGEIKALKAGKTTITVKTSNGNKANCVINIYPRVDSLASDKTDIYIGKKDSEKLKYIIGPKDAKVLKEKWKIEDDSIATIDGNKVTGKKLGSTKVYLTINDKLKLTYNINIVKTADKIELDDINVNIGEEKKIKPKLKPSSADDVPFIYNIEDKELATIDENGTIKGLKEGKTNIEVSTPYGVKKTVSVKVKKVLVRSISLNYSNVTKRLSESIKLKADIKPNDATDKTIKWSSSDEKVATVDKDGKVKFKKKGKVTITAKSSNDIKAKCTINIKNNTHDRSAIFIGDSITYGYLSTPKGYGWGDYIGDHYDIGKTVNAGKSGWLISNYKDKLWLKTEVENYKNKKYDYVIMHGGINDTRWGVPLGTYNANDYSGKYDTKTFLGGLETYIYTAKKQWPNAKFGYIINYETPNCNKNTVTLAPEYYIVMKKVLDKWNIKYLDLYYGSTPDGVKYSDLLKVKTKEYIPDGLHINRAGYRLLSPYIYDWMNTL